MILGKKKKTSINSYYTRTKNCKAMKLTEILSKEEYNNLTQFSEQDIIWLENRIYQGVNDDGKPVARVNCIIREKEIEVKPEEIVRQLYVYKLIEEYGYPKKSAAL
jgi:hypothetical protein